ncbi:hypothetical protein Cfor_08830, partial [Coptotermes formosanus]
RFESGAHQVSPRAGRHDAGKSSGYVRLGEQLQELSGRNAEGQLQTALLDEEAYSFTGNFLHRPIQTDQPKKFTDPRQTK